MIKVSRNRRQPVALRPSRIRRDPPPRAGATGAPGKARYWDPRTSETWMVVTGVALFGIALAIIAFGFSDFLSR